MTLLVLVVLPLFVASAVLPIWAAVDAAVQPDAAYARTGQNKLVWVVVSLFTCVIGPLVYFLAIRPRLRAAA
jgi:heme/copper-type cytochrome/quinol oxidase subunit 2